jgi:hypothetical protein
MYEKNGEWIVEVSEDEVEQSIAYLTDLREAMMENEKTKHRKNDIGHISIAIETMIAFCMEHFELEEDDG